MGSSDKAAVESTATDASAGAEQLAEQVRALEAVIAHYEHLLSGIREASREWERIFDAVEDPICIVAADYRLLYVNAAYERLFGTTYEFGGQHYCFERAASHMSPSDQSDLLTRSGPCEACPLPETVRTRRAAFTQQVWQSSGEGGTASVQRVYQRWTYPVVNVDGTVDRVVEMLKDVTEQERMRRSVTKTDALREADRLKAELLGTVSHELRSPLTAIKGYAATLLRHERRLPREERREFLEAIGEASDRLEVIINRLLEMSQLETGSIVPHCAPVDAAQVAREAIAVAEQRVYTNEPSIYRFVLRLPDEGTQGGQHAPLLVEADPRLLRDVLDNLLENAIKYSPEGGSIEVTIGMRRTDGSDSAPAATDALVVAEQAGEARQAGAAGEVEHAAAVSSPDMLEIVVRDTGVGIPAEHLGRVFERFHRVDMRLTREVDGLGLGLAMCKRIAELHGGAIWAESAPGEGSAFHLLLPLVASNATDQAQASALRRS